MRIIIASALFAATWLLWSGHYAPPLLFLGALSCMLVLLLARRIGFFADDAFSLHLGSRAQFFLFWFWLLVEIAKANLQVLRIILSRRLPIEPCVVALDVSHLSPVHQATFANAVTLTPGTLTMDVDRGRLEVHCLTREIAEELCTGKMLRRVEAIGGR